MYFKIQNIFQFEVEGGGRLDMFSQTTARSLRVITFLLMLGNKGSDEWLKSYGSLNFVSSRFSDFFPKSLDAI